MIPHPYEMNRKNLDDAIELVKVCGLPLPFTKEKLIADKERIRKQFTSAMYFDIAYSLLTQWAEIDLFELLKLARRAEVSASRFTPPKKQSFFKLW